VIPKEPTPDELAEAMRQGEIIAERLGQLVDEYPEMRYLGSSILSYGIGLMQSQGVTEEEVLYFCHQLIQQGKLFEQAGVS